MPVLELQRRVSAPPDLVWGVVADLGGDTGRQPFTSRIDLHGPAGLGATRRLHLQDGQAWSETCVDWVPGERYTMEIAAAEFPARFASLRYTCVVAPADAWVLLRLYFDYQSRFALAGGLLDRFKALPALRSHAAQVLDDWVRTIHVREWAHRVTVGSLLAEKGSLVHSIGPEQPVRDASALLKARRIGALVVLNPDASIAGVVSERDIVVGLAEQGGQLLEQSVASIMSRRVFVAEPAENMLHVMARMSERRIRHLPVVDQGRVLGLISIGDVIKARISELEGQSASLQEYIATRRWHDLYREIGPFAYSDGALSRELRSD